MAIKYTEEQLNTVDKSIIIQMFLNQQEELSKAVPHRGICQYGFAVSACEQHRK